MMISGREEDQKGWQGGDNEGGIQDGRATALLQLIEPDHHRPHFFILADQQGEHEVGVGRGEGG